MGLDGILLYLSVSLVLAVIPASIARNKGYHFGLWWFFAWLLWPAAFICVMVIHDKRQDSTDEIIKYKKLLDENVITQEEFDKKREQLLNL